MKQSLGINHLNVTSSNTISALLVDSELSGERKIELKMESEVKSLLEQPREILELILGHLDTKASKEAALVCPYFYEMICYSRRKKLQSLSLYNEVSMA